MPSLNPFELNTGFGNGQSPFMSSARMQPIEVRKPTKSEQQFFRNNPTVSGMAAEDDRVILNPFSTLNEQEKQSVIQNETLRIMLRRGLIPPPTFALTPEQGAAFAFYGPLLAQRETILSRLVSGDPSALTPTGEQRQVATSAFQALQQFLAPRNPSAPFAMAGQ